MFIHLFSSQYYALYVVLYLYFCVITSVTDKEVATKNIVTSAEMCSSSVCTSCVAPQCQLCLPCLPPDSLDTLKRAYREHNSRHQFCRIFPPTMVSPMFAITAYRPLVGKSLFTFKRMLLILLIYFFLLKINSN